MRFATRFAGGLAALAWLTGPQASSAQVEVSPRIEVLSGSKPAPDATVGIGVRGRTTGSVVTPYASIHVRGGSVDTFDDSDPSGGGLLGTLGAHVENGEPGMMRAYAALGIGLSVGSGDDGGEEFAGEVEAGLTIPTSDSFGVLLALRLVRLADTGTSVGGTVGVAWRLGG